MRVRGVLVPSLTMADVSALVEGRVPESQELEYKRDLPGKKDEDTREFLADISSFANTTGGVLLYGVATGKDENGRDSGIPEGIEGLPKSVGENDLLRLSQILHDGFSPRFSGEVIRVIESPGSLRIVALGVRRSLLGPHMIWSGRSGKVFARKGAHKDQVDAVELRRMFLESSSWVDEAEAFRAARVEPAAKNSASLDYLASGDAGRLLLHVLPLGRLGRRLDLRPHEVALRDLGRLFCRLEDLIPATTSRAICSSVAARVDGARRYNGFVLARLNLRTAAVMERDMTVSACSALTG
jgi:schlafen family protein